MFLRTSLPLKAAILGLLWQGAVQGSLAQKEKSARAFAGNLSAHSSAIAVPFEYYKQHIYISVQVDDVPGLIFMLDTGASRNVLNLRTARQLGAASRRLKQEKKVGFGAEHIYTAPETPVRAEIESVPIARVMSVIDLSHFERHSGHVLDGILGYPFLQKFVVKLDFRNERLTFSPKRFVYRGPGLRIGILQQRTFPVIPITIGSSQQVHHQTNVVIDTGSNGTLMLYERFVRRLSLQESLLHTVAAKAYGLNGYYDVRLGSVRSIQIGSAIAHSVSVDYVEPEEEVHLDRGVSGEIGNGILQGFLVVVFDVPHGQIVLLPKESLVGSGTVRTYTVGP